jgi:allophanate hydrolase subunit 2
VGGLVLRALEPCTVAVGPVVHELAAHDVVRVGPGALRQYVAVAGGVDVQPVLGSRSRDTLADLGPAPLSVGDVVPCGTARGACVVL